MASAISSTAFNPHDSLVRYSNYQAYDPSFDLTYGDFYHCDRPNP